MPPPRRRFLQAALALPALGACAPDGGGTPAPHSTQADIAYGAHVRQTLDLHTPRDMRADAPVLIWFHGGAFHAGSKDRQRYVGEAFCSRGIATVQANYRLMPDVPLSAVLEDAARATAWTGGEGQPLLPSGPRVVIGHSAGAFLAVLLALDPRWLNRADGAPVAGAIGLAGSYDLALRGPLLSTLFPVGRGQPDPIAFAGQPGPPLLLLHGRRDVVVPAYQSERLEERRRAAGQPVRLALYPDLAHMTLLGALGQRGRRSAPAVLDDITAFVAGLSQ